VSEAPEQDSKTEAPTQKHLNDAVEKGNTPFSREATAFGAISAMLIGSWVLVPQATERLSVPLRGLLANAGDIALTEPGKLRALVSELSFSVGAAIAPLLFVLCLFAFGTAAFQNAPNAVFERIEPKLSRISLKEGFKRFYGIPSSRSLRSRSSSSPLPASPSSMCSAPTSTKSRRCWPWTSSRSRSQRSACSRP
jgi:flagellar biosynthetic protein FlhB